MHKASGQFYGDVLAERVFKPLGMTTARVISEADIVPNRAAGYGWSNGELQEPGVGRAEAEHDGRRLALLVAAGLIAWDAAVKRRAILKPESWAQILTPVRAQRAGSRIRTASAGRSTSAAASRCRSTAASWQGFKTQLSRFVGDDLSIVVLANLAQADPARFVDGIAAIVNPALAMPQPTPIADTEPQVAEKLRRLLDAARAERSRLPSSPTFAPVSSRPPPTSVQRGAREARPANSRAAPAAARAGRRPRLSLSVDVRWGDALRAAGACTRRSGLDVLAPSATVTTLISPARRRPPAPAAASAACRSS